MECDDQENTGDLNASVDDNVGSSALNSTILNYYKKFGRKRDLEQYFSLSTAQTEIRDPTSLFWRRMKSQSDSDSGEKKSESSTEICRISIKCSVPEIEPSSSQDENPKTKSDSESPPIITEDVAADTTRHSDAESVKSDDNRSLKSADVTLDTSINKPLSPTSSITSRKLEWDSLADVGYGNETDRKNSASSLSTLERLALKQQYSNNETHDLIGPPTAHSTPQDENDTKPKSKKGIKTTRINRRDVDVVEVNVPHCSEMNPSQAINVNLTKHISFNVEKGGGITMENVQKDISVKPEKASVEIEVAPKVTDKEIQTSLTKSKDKSSLPEFPKTSQFYGQGVPVLINLNSLRKRNRRKKFRTVRKKLRNKRKSDADKENLPIQEKSGEQVSEAESFEYMPGHIYNQNQMKVDGPRTSNAAGNKSSLESSGVLTTDSSKGSKHSFTKDLEKSITLLKTALQKRYNDSDLKQKLIREIVERLLKSNYRGDESTTDFLSGLSFSSKKLGLSESNHTTTSTSDANNTGDKMKLTRPKKSILRVDKFNPQTIASTSQSAPNLPSMSTSEKLVATHLNKPLISSTTESDVSSKEKYSSDTAFAKTSSEELYQKYIDALRREENYKKHLRDKEVFLKQKLVCSDTAIKIPARVDLRSQSKLKDLMKDLTRNNYDDGSGDASKLEGGSNSNIGSERYVARKQRSHSVFTLSSGASESQSRKVNPRNNEANDANKAGHSRYHCCCLHHSKDAKMPVTDSSVQVNIKAYVDKDHRQTPRNIGCIPENTPEIKCECLCNQRPTDGNYLLQKSRWNTKGTAEEISSNVMDITTSCHINEAKLNFPSTSKATTYIYDENAERISKSSQTSLPLFGRKVSDKSLTSIKPIDKGKDNVYIHEATRCIQTEISINPQISDPSLSAINIINNADCVEFVEERYREISKSSIHQKIDHPVNVAPFYAGSEYSEDHASTPDSNNYDRDEEDGKLRNSGYKLVKGIQTDFGNIEHKTTNIPDDNIIHDNFAIPIQGTNMTLMVSLGTHRDNADIESLKKQVTKVVATDTIDTTEKATSLREECSKGVQSQSTTIFPQIDAQNRECLNNNDKVDENCLVNTIFTREGFFNKIYPDEMHTTKQVPLLRSNATDIEVENSRCVQTDTEDNIFSKASRETITDGHLTRPKADLTPKCQCPECMSTKCVRSCGQGADCMKQHKPFLRSNTDGGLLVKANKETLGVKDSGYQTVPNNPKYRCSEPAKYKDIFEEGTNMDPKPFRSTTTDTCEFGAAKESLSSLEKRENVHKSAAIDATTVTQPFYEDDAQCIKKKLLHGPVTTDTAYLRNEFNKYPSQKIVSGDDGKSLKPKPLFRSATVDSAQLENTSNKSTKQTHKNSPRLSIIAINDKSKCKCPESVRCGGVCGEEADCMKQMPCNRESPRITETAKKPNCYCPASVNCGGVCEGNAPCIKEKCAETNKKRSEDVKYNTHPKNDKVNNRKGFLRSNTDVSDFERNETDPNVKPQSINSIQSSSVKGTSEDTIKSTSESQTQSKSKTTDSEESGTPKDLVLEMIQGITKRYSKKDIQKNQRKKCFKEIMTVLNYLLDTDDSPDPEQIKALLSSTTQETDAECSTNKTKAKKICTYCRGNKDKSRCPECGGNDEELPDSSESNICQVKSVETYEINKLNTVERSKNPDTDCVTCKETECTCRKKIFVDKGVQLSAKKSKTTVYYTGSSDNPVTTDIPCTSSDSATCKVLNKIKKECEKFHQKRCLSHGVKRCECSSSTSVNCDNCKRVHHCHCRGHKCRGHRSKSTADKIKKKCVAYNLIIQTSESMVSEENSVDKNCRPLQNIIVKVPPKRQCVNVPFKELAAKIEGRQQGIPRNVKCQRSRSLPNESGLSSTDENNMSNMYTVREYLEKNRPDFVEHCSKRQNCLKSINEVRTQASTDAPRMKMIVVHTPNCNGCVDPCAMYCGPSMIQMNCSCGPCMDAYMQTVENEVTRLANERAVNRELLSMQLQMERPSTLNALSESDLRHLARELGVDCNRKKVAPKFISEQAMKQHSEKIYKSLPEVTRKTEEAKKESIKKTNLLMASIFKKNLQKKTLRGAVNLSNYSTVVKI